MLVLYLVVLLISAYGLGLRKDSTHGEALSIEQCNAIKGISILLVFISHASQYVTTSGYSYSMVGDNLFLQIKSAIGQLCVVMFFFYSGYGIERSIATKGEQYVRNMPKRRLLTTLINFDIAVVIFLIANLLLGTRVSLSRFVISLFAWDSIGNSEWYIFDILVLYAISYISSLMTSNPGIRFGLVLSMTVLLIVVLQVFKGSWWYNTLLAYPAGVLLAMNKERVVEQITKHFWSILLGLFMLSAALLIFRKSHVIVYNAASVAFAFMVVTLTFRIRIQNRCLIWLGTQLFPLYIYQRLPMMAINELHPSMIRLYPLLFVFSSLLITILITFSYKYWKVSFR